MFPSLFKVHLVLLWKALQDLLPLRPGERGMLTRRLVQAILKVLYSQTIGPPRFRMAVSTIKDRSPSISHTRLGHLSVHGLQVLQV